MSSHRARRPSVSVAALALAAIALSATSGCKSPPIDEDWARSMMLAHTAQLGLLEEQLDKALRTYAHAPADDPNREKNLDADVEQTLRNASWVTAWAPVELTVEGNEAASGARSIPFKPPKSIEGGSRRTKGKPIGDNRQLYWGKFDVDGEKGGVEVLTQQKSGPYTLNVRIFVIPGAPRLLP